MPLSYSIYGVRTPHATEARTRLVTGYVGGTVMEALNENAWILQVSDEIRVPHYDYIEMLRACAQVVETDRLKHDPALRAMVEQLV